jgi:hypothetical protein
MRTNPKAGNHKITAAAAATALLLTASTSAASTIAYAIQFGPGQGGSGVLTGDATPAYTGSLFAGATNVTPISGGYLSTGNWANDNSAGLSYTLGTATLAFTSAFGLYNVGGQNTAIGPTDVSYLDSSFFYTDGDGPAPTNVTLALTGLSPADTVDFKFIESRQGKTPAVTITGSSGPQVTDITNSTSFVDAGSFTGLNTYNISVTYSGGGANESDVSGALITITAIPEPAPLALLAATGVGLLLLGRKRPAT